MQDFFFCNCWPPKRFSLIVSLKSAKCVFVNLGEAVGRCPHLKLIQGLIEILAKICKASSYYWAQPNGYQPLKSAMEMVSPVPSVVFLLIVMSFLGVMKPK